MMMMMMMAQMKQNYDSDVELECRIMTDDYNHDIKSVG